MTLTIRTSNQNKLAEFLRSGFDVNIEPGVDLREVAGTPTEVVVHKALDSGPGIIVEDTSLDIEGYAAGVNIRWALDQVTADMRQSGCALGPKAVWRVMVAYHLNGLIKNARCIPLLSSSG
jgi:hypothetical protein